MTARASRRCSPWSPTRFDRDGVKEAQSKLLGTLENTYKFFALYANLDGWRPDPAQPAAPAPPPRPSAPARRDDRDPGRGRGNSSAIAPAASG